jgi:tetratricopeptide (TPR) repeat protein
MEKIPSFDHLLIPDEAQDLHSLVGMTAEEDQPHLFVSLPKVVWVHIYGLLDVPTLFRAQRVCVRWRNLVNQPICWFARSQALAELEMKLHAERSGDARDYSTREWSEDENTASVHDDDEITVLCGPASVASLKRQCKSLFVRQAVLAQHFEPREPAVVTLMESAGAAADELKEALWSEAWALEPCGKIAFERGRFYENLERFEESVQHYGFAVKQCPWDHGVRTRLGLTYHKWGRLEEALQNYLKTAALAPNYQLAWNNAGSIFFNTGFFERAKTCFSRCVLLDKRAGVAYNNRGLCRFLAGDGAGAGALALGASF